MLESRTMSSRFKMGLIVLLATVLFPLGLSSNESEAGRRWRRHHHPVQRQNFPVYGSYKYSYYNKYYPKYIGGFNASYFDSIGVPSGDIGLRGNGIYMTPW